MKHTVWAIVAAITLLPHSRLFAHEGGKHEHEIKEPAKGTRAYTAMKKNYSSMVAPILINKCMDCHSSSGHFPWYYNLPLAKSLIDRDIRNARRLLDLTNGFPFSGLGTLSDHLTGLHTVATDNSMPPLQYKLAHWSSRLTQAEREIIIAWTAGKLPPAAAPNGSPGKKK